MFIVIVDPDGCVLLVDLAFLKAADSEPRLTFASVNWYWCSAVASCSTITAATFADENDCVKATSQSVYLKLKCSRYTVRAHILLQLQAFYNVFPTAICHLLWQLRVLTRTNETDPSPRENLMKVLQRACFLCCAIMGLRIYIVWLKMVDFQWTMACIKMKKVGIDS